MTICQECESEIAELDTFCPSCGISLQPLPVAGKSTEDAFASTIVMSSPCKSDPAVMPDHAKHLAPTPAIEQIDELKSKNLAPVVDPVLEPISDTPPQSETFFNDPEADKKTEESVWFEEDPDNVKTIESLAGEIQDDHEAFPTADDGSAKEPRADHDFEVNAESQVDSPIHIEEKSLIAAKELAEELKPATAEFVEEAPRSKGEESVAYIDSNEVALSEPFGKTNAGRPEQIVDAEPNVQPGEHLSNEAVSDRIKADESPETSDAVEPEDAHEILPERIENQPEELEVQSQQEVEANVSDADEDSEMEAAFADVAPEAEPEAEPAFDDSALAVVTADPIDSASIGPVAPTDSGQIVADSGTTPNIGGADTDGRKSGLKPLAEGTLLNKRYKIIKKIGGGGMGAVYLASDQNLGDTQRAVKEMVQSHIEEEQQAKAIDDFKRESMILSTLDHPSIPTIYDYFYDDVESRFYLVMKYISGGDLASRLRAAPEGRIDERTVTEWSIQIIDVLDYLHSLPTTIVYRDLKPSNVMIDGNTGRIMLIDFGIARSINQTQEKGVTAVGTMGYAPPELFSGQVEPRSDIYSLGSTMFHLLTGADPQNNPLLIFDFQKNPRPRQINPRLSDQMEKILMRAVEYSADARFSTAADMHRALTEHLENLRNGHVTYGVSEIPAAVSLANQNVFCGFCGQRIVATDMFCAFCGSKQPLAQHGVHSEIYATAGATARLVIEGTSELDIPAYPLEKSENLVGRRDPMSNIFPEVDLSKYDPQTKISRRHARIWRDGNSYLVEDLGSSNGTMLLTKVSDTLRLVPHQPHPLAAGDRLRIGDTTLHFILS